MTGSANPTEAHEDEGFLAPEPDSQPYSRCFRCGKQTPAGVGLCDEHNRGHLSGPSPTQMHATVFLGIVAGVISFFLLISLAVSRTGPYGVEITSSTSGPQGGVLLSFTVTNEGDSTGVADCRVTRDGVARPDDLAFRTASLPGGEALAMERELTAPPEGSVGYDSETITVVCT